jgi:hypothetical protein
MYYFCESSCLSMHRYVGRCRHEHSSAKRVWMAPNSVYHLWEATCHKHPHILESGKTLLCHDNVSAHQSILVQEYLIKNDITVLLHVSLLFRSSPCRLLPVPKNESPLEGIQKRWRRLRSQHLRSHKKRPARVLTKVVQPLTEMCDSRLELQIR